MNKERLKKIYLATFGVIVALLVSFYFLAGNELKYRDSRKNFLLTEANGTTKEVTRGVVVEQFFNNKVERLKSVSFLCTTQYRQNYGEMTVRVLDGEEELFSGKVDVSTIKENEPVVISSDEYIEGHLGRELKIEITANSSYGKGVSILMNGDTTVGTKLYVGNKMYGAICFGVSGQEYIFTGQHYWQIMLTFCGVVGLILFLSYKKYSKDGSGYIPSAINAIIRYSFLISQLVSRDFKTKYKRSILGVFWSFLNPLLTMTVQYVVFSTLFRNDIKNYSVYLLAGIVCFSFYNEVTNMCLQSISSNANLIKKVYMPKYIFPLSRTMSSSINLFISLIPLLLITLVSGLGIHPSFILMFFFLVCLIIFALGVGMILSALMVFFRDIQFLWSVLVMMWQYATPIFYSPNIIPERFQFILKFNPLYHFIKNIRICIIDGISPEPRAYMYCFVFALASLLIGSLVFKKTQDKFTLYL